MKKRERAEIDRTGDLTTETIEIQRLIGDCYEQLYNNKKNNLKHG